MKITGTAVLLMCIVLGSSFVVVAIGIGGIGININNQKNTIHNVNGMCFSRQAVPFVYMVLAL